MSYLESPSLQEAVIDDSHEGSDASMEDIYTMVMEGLLGYENPADRYIPVAHFSLNLSTVTDFCDARQLFEDIAAMEKIRRESEERRKMCAALLERARLENWIIDVERHSVSVIENSGEPLPQEEQHSNASAKPHKGPLSEVHRSIVKKGLAILKKRHISTPSPVPPSPQFIPWQNPEQETGHPRLPSSQLLHRFPARRVLSLCFSATTSFGESRLTPFRYKILIALAAKPIILMMTPRRDYPTRRPSGCADGTPYFSRTGRRLRPGAWATPATKK
ncbi:hypothetical protein BV25DRAFT_1840598 [Artomyces pyxidatus]|uniref:Uncharacterized protein n=1 Tax=Artomyces pyxidatus TaxID=48021 RepID=A0ACB8STK9_9AGAM|nr:hypothetical protein BV25DRAFT_1840598 [Artomyces pyxidatus]